MPNKNQSKEFFKEMLLINEEQKEYYEKQFYAKKENKSFQKNANYATNLWTISRRKFSELRQSVGISGYKYELHKKWMSDFDLGKRDVLDLGCFSGNELSLWIAKNSRNYLGIDLSEHAIGLLAEKLENEQITHGRAQAMDFLNNDFEDNSFDLIYAHAVMHHFKDLQPVLDEIKRILKPNGYIISVDPLQTDPFNRLFRILYRPFQSDKDWEWPFTWKTLKLINSNFTMKEVQGIQGMAKIGFPFLLLPGCSGLGKRLSNKGFKFDNNYANKMGISLRFCWQLTMLLQNNQK